MFAVFANAQASTGIKKFDFTNFTFRIQTSSVKAMPNDIYSTDLEGNNIKNKTALTKFRKSLIKVEDLKNSWRFTVKNSSTEQNFVERRRDFTL